MRDILFRGKRERDGKWIEGSSLYDPDLELSQINGFEYACTAEGLQRTQFCEIVDPETVGQYIGLSDINGSDIFKGDIVRILDHQVGYVVEECGAYGIAVSPYIDWDYLDSKIAEITGCNNEPYFCYNDNFISFWELMWNYNREEDSCDVVEVIGNIHDNPELLHLDE